MKPIPEEMLKLWGGLWHADAHLTRPWWRLASNGFWVRVDGGDVTADRRYRVPRVSLLDFWEKRRPDVRVMAEIEKIDAGQPVGAPPPMEGQVWKRPGFSEPGMLLHVHAAVAGALCLTWGSPRGQEYIPWGDGLCSLINAEWPPEDAFLVAGPTPWGRDVPWSPA